MNFYRISTMNCFKKCENKVMHLKNKGLLGMTVQILNS